ncbi:aminotransferase class V-fold PLP-dependent enzyme [Pseudonocardia sp. CA-107938]|uniref:aminotransferase class V-fold PLP-dependent enzyme n=1 Tax=Pseudonocardia sp. CA-107938 TaxID=3240021 RepID=UPI003D89F6BC
MTIVEPLPPWAGRGAGYLNTASYGLPPDAAVDAAAAWIEQWRAGSAPLADWLAPTDQARAAFAALTGVAAADVATGTSVSQLVGLVAASVPDGSLVLAEEGEFTSLLFPFLVQAGRGVQVETVPRDRLPDVAAERGDVVAFSLVRSSDGTPVDHAAISAAAAARGALTLADASQACGWMALAEQRFDLLVAPAFKWLGAPRGTAFLALRPEHVEWLVPVDAGWWASPGAAQQFGGPLALAPDARRLDTSPVWNSWGATTAAMTTVADLGVDPLRHHVLGLADRFCRGRGLPAAATPIVEVRGAAVADRLARAGVVVTRRPHGARLSFGPATSSADVDRALEALDGR